MNRRHLQLFFVLAIFALICLALPLPAQKPSPPKIPAQIELLETHIRFESNGDSRKEVHTRVHINDELGAAQFARLNFDYNRAFQQIDIPSLRITHASGGTADILPSAITDQPNPAVVGLPAYQDVRVKSVRILGLAPGDNLDYRVITTTTHHPLAPDFWLDHTFERSGATLHEIFELDLPGSMYFEAKFPPGCPSEWMFAWHGSKARVCGAIPYSSTSEGSPEATTSHSVLRWDISPASAKAQGDAEIVVPDVIVSTFDSGISLVTRLSAALGAKPENQSELRLHLQSARSAGASDVTLQDAYDFVSQKLHTVDLPVGATGFRLRAAKDVLDSGYAIPEEKCALLSDFARDLSALSPSPKNPKSATDAQIVFLTSPQVAEEPLRPSMLVQPLVVVSVGKKQLALDPSVEVAPFALIPPSSRGKRAFSLTPQDAGDYQTARWLPLPQTLPFAAFQKVDIEATLATDGTLNAKVRYVMRGDNELLLRIAFHQTTKDKWNQVAQLLSLSDGFRGQITKVNASDPYATHDPFTIEYEISQPQFVNWSKKPVRIPAILPLLGLPDPPASPSSEIQIGTPLNVETHLTLHLPAGTTAQTPTGTSVNRDYATFSSQYSAQDGVISAARHISFLSRSLPSARAMDYNAFLHAVQSDESQLFTLSSPPSR